MMIAQSQTLPTILWAGIPALIILSQILIETLVPHQYLSALHSENGPHESLQFVFAFLALIYAFRCLFRLIPQKQPLLIAWVTCFCLSCAYIAGEEISWGQHIFEWGTPEFWSSVNDQDETNLHNTSSWLDQKPRLILLIGIVVGGLIIPLMQRLKSKYLPQKITIIYPPAILSVTAICAIGIKIVDFIDKHFINAVVLSRGSEVEELFMFYFVLLYLIILHARIKKAYAG